MTEKQKLAKALDWANDNGYIFYGAWIATEEDEQNTYPYAPACEIGDVLATISGRDQGSVEYDINLGQFD